MTDSLQLKVKELFKNSNLNPNSIRNILLKNLDIKKELEEEFALHPDLYVSIGKLVLLIIRDIQLAKCKVCGKTLNYDFTVGGSKNKFCSNKCKLSKEGNPFANKEIQEKIKQVNLAKYGVENPAKSKIIKDKMKATTFARYGVENVYQSKEIQEKIKKNCLAKYGVKCYNQTLECKLKVRKTAFTHTYNKIINKFKGYVEPAFTLEEYKGTNKKYNWKCCTCGKIFNTFYRNGWLGSRCFKCYPRKNVKTSKYEVEIADLIRHYGFEVDCNNREILKPKELDIVVHDKKFAIEFNGNYWHSYANKKDKFYHFCKANLSEANGYYLMQIFEGEWLDPNKQVLIRAKIRNVLGVEQKRVYGRNCYVNEISKKAAKEFLLDNCIEGEDKSDIRLGLFNKKDNELLSVMTFKKRDGVFSISRYSNDIDVYVIGGVSKILKYLERVYDPDRVEVMIDRRFSYGSAYRRIEFELDRIIDPVEIDIDGFNEYNAGYYVFSKTYK